MKTMLNWLCRQGVHFWKVFVSNKATVRKCKNCGIIETYGPYDTWN